MRDRDLDADGDCGFLPPTREEFDALERRIAAVATAGVAVSNRLEATEDVLAGSAAAALTRAATAQATADEHTRMLATIVEILARRPSVPVQVSRPSIARRLARFAGAVGAAAKELVSSQASESGSAK